MILALMVASAAANIAVDCAPESWCANETEQEANADAFIQVTHIWKNMGEVENNVWSWRQHSEHVLRLTDRLKADLYQYVLTASTHMDVYGTRSSLLLGQGATSIRMIIEDYAPSLVIVTPQTDAGLFLAVVAVGLISYLVFRLLQYVARLGVAVLRCVLSCCSLRKKHAEHAKGNYNSGIEPGCSNINLVSVERSRLRSASGARASTPPPPVKNASGDINAASWKVLEKEKTALRSA